MSDISQIMGGFNADEYTEHSNDDTPLPAGEYYVEVEKAELRETQNKQGTGCNVQFSVLGSVADNSHKGRKVFVWYNLQHSNETAQKIGQSEFHALRIAIGKPTAQDTDELIGIPLIAKVTIDKKDLTKNKIVKYTPIAGRGAAPAQSAQTPPPVAAPAAAATKTKMPWD